MSLEVSIEFKNKYPRFTHVMLCYLSDFASEDVSDKELLQSFFNSSPQAMSQFLEEANHLLNEDLLLWQDISCVSNRYFDDESDARQWLEELISA
jgi:hypothetical protein